MFSSSKKTYRQNDSNLKTSETLFQFLKKKKQMGMDNSLQHSRLTNSKTLNNTSRIDFSQINAQTERAPPAHLKNQRIQITPKKVSFADQEYSSIPKKSKNNFIDMISPLKKRSSICKVSQQKIPQNNIQKQNKSNKKNLSEKFPRKNMNQSVTILKSTLQSLIAEGQSIKQKAHSLAVELRPILKFVQEGSNKNFAKRAQQTKQKLRIFEYSFKQFDIERANQKIEIFHQNLSQHILSVQGQIKANYNKQQDQTVIRMKQNYESKIRNLMSQKQGLQKKVDILQRKNEKLETSLAQLEEKYDEKIQNFHEINANKSSQYNQTLKNLQDQNIQLQERVQQFINSQKQIKSQLKDALYAKQQIQKRLRSQNDKVKSAKQQFLIHQISIMKEEFQKDMKQLATLYNSKQSQQITIITQLKNQIDQLKKYRQIQKNRQKFADQQSDNFRVLSTKYKRQNQCLVTDMHRMNQQLYQHWLALRDIKTLASRLNIMDKFQRVYADIPFNDQLFS